MYVITVVLLQCQKMYSTISILFKLYFNFSYIPSILFETRVRGITYYMLHAILREKYILYSLLSSNNNVHITADASKIFPPFFSNLLQICVQTCRADREIITQYLITFTQQTLKKIILLIIKDRNIWLHHFISNIYFCCWERIENSTLLKSFLNIFSNFSFKETFVKLMVQVPVNRDLSSCDEASHSRGSPGKKEKFFRYQFFIFMSSQQESTRIN